MSTWPQFNLSINLASLYQRPLISTNSCSAANKLMWKGLRLKFSALRMFSLTKHRREIPDLQGVGWSVPRSPISQRVKVPLVLFTQTKFQKKISKRSSLEPR